MSIRVMNRIWEDAPYEGGKLLLLLALADYANEDGICWPGNEALAHKARLTARRVITLLDELEAAGDVASVPGRGRGHRTVYAVLAGLAPNDQEKVREKLRNNFSETISPFPIKGEISRTQKVKSRAIKGEISRTQKVKSAQENQASFTALEYGELDISQNDNRHGEPSLDPSLDPALSPNGDGGRANDAQTEPPSPLKSAALNQFGTKHSQRAKTQHAQQQPEPPTPVPLAPSPGALPIAIATAAADWLRPGGALNRHERELLLSLYGTYGADWLERGIPAAVKQGGHAIGYLVAMCERCKAEGTIPGEPKGKGKNNGANHQRSRPIDLEATERARIAQQSGRTLADDDPELMRELQRARAARGTHGRRGPVPLDRD